MIIRRPHEAPERPVGHGRSSPLKLALEQVVVGGFVFVSSKEKSPKSAAACAYHHGKRMRRRFSCAPIVFEGQAGCGIWRLADPVDVVGDWERAVVHAAGLEAPAKLGRPTLRVAGR